VQYGPAKTWVKSITVMPARGAGRLMRNPQLKNS
jgi:hypothetical protein